MDIEKLTNRKQFENLKKGDTILIKWDDYFVKHTKSAKPIMLYNIAKIQGNEIICQRKDNHYFNYDMYLKGDSVALEVCKID